MHDVTYNSLFMDSTWKNYFEHSSKRDSGKYMILLLPVLRDMAFGIPGDNLEQKP